MHKKTAYILAALLLAVTIIQSERTRVLAATSHTHPRIVAEIALTNQTAPIPTTTIFTPQATGVYRISAYITVTQPGDGQGVWSLEVFWTDDAGAEVSCLPNVNNAAKPPFAYANPIPALATFEAKAGVPVTFSVTGSTTGTYSLYFTVEQLQ
jgi:hypothetical protein